MDSFNGTFNGEAVLDHGPIASTSRLIIDTDSTESSSPSLPTLPSSKINAVGLNDSSNSINSRKLIFPDDWVLTTLTQEAIQSSRKQGLPLVELVAVMGSRNPNLINPLELVQWTSKIGRSLGESPLFTWDIIKVDGEGNTKEKKIWSMKIVGDYEEIDVGGVEEKQEIEGDSLLHYKFPDFSRYQPSLTFLNLSQISAPPGQQIVDWKYLLVEIINNRPDKRITIDGIVKVLMISYDHFISQGRNECKQLIQENILDYCEIVESFDSERGGLTWYYYLRDEFQPISIMSEEEETEGGIEGEDSGKSFAELYTDYEEYSSTNPPFIESHLYKEEAARALGELLTYFESTSNPPPIH